MRTLDQRTAMEARVNDLVDQLGSGRERCRSSYSLARSIGVPQRSIGFIANAARRQGHLIGSVHGEGYYMIATHAELDETIAHIANRVAGIQRTIESLRTAWFEAAS